MKLSILVPVFNESNTLEEIVRRIEATEHDKEIILVDDFSTDGTRDILKCWGSVSTTTHSERTQIRIFFHDRNQGKGAAIRTALRNMTGDVAIIQDADLEYDPAEYDLLLKPILDNKADVVYGSRFLGGPHRVLFFWHQVGNRFLTLLSNIFTNLNLSDVETCYKVFTADAARRLELKSNRFGFDPEITALFAKFGYRIFEVPISYAGRTYEEGKKIGWRDGLVVLWAIVRHNVFRHVS